jgi:hypothetical protein
MILQQMRRTGFMTAQEITSMICIGDGSSTFLTLALVCSFLEGLVNFFPKLGPHSEGIPPCLGQVRCLPGLQGKSAFTVTENTVKWYHTQIISRHFSGSSIKTFAKCMV